MKKKALFVFVSAMVLYVIYNYISTIEVTKATLRCEEKEYVVENQPTSTSFLTITSKLLNSNDLSLYTSNPDTDRNGFPPYLSGVSIGSNRAEGNPRNLKHFSPYYYVFTSSVLSEEHNNKNAPRLNMIIYINRENFKIETVFSDDQKVWSDGSCVVVDKNYFDEDWKQKVDKMKSKIKI